MGKRDPFSAPAFLAIANAVENASPGPVTQAGIVAMLRDGQGASSQLRALFSDVSLQTLESAAACAGLELRTVLNSYRIAQESVAAANGELDRALDEPW